MESIAERSYSGYRDPELFHWKTHRKPLNKEIMISYKSTIIPAFVIITAAVACGRPEAATPKENGTLDSIIRNVTTTPVTVENETEYIKLNGKIQANEDHQAKVYALASGKIKSVNVALGDKVQKGQTLAVLQSMEVASSSNDV